MKALKHLPIITICMFYTMTLCAQPKIIAHRGFWDCEGSAQNSIFALERAQQIGIYGSEFDVLLTSDGIPVVNHDNRIRGLLIENTPYRKLKNVTLTNGEKLPTLESYLKQGLKDKQTLLILEINPNSTKEKEDAAVEKITALVKKMGATKQTEYISFSLHICKSLLNIDPNAKVAYLNGDMSPAALKELGLSGLDYNSKVLQKHPEWVAEAKKLGLTVNVWTVNNQALMREMIDLGVDFITTDKPLELKALIGQE